MALNRGSGATSSGSALGSLNRAGVVETIAGLKALVTSEEVIIVEGYYRNSR